jgi:hypothetical protein
MVHKSPRRAADAASGDGRRGQDLFGGTLSGAEFSRLSDMSVPSDEILAAWLSR